MKRARETAVNEDHSEQEAKKQKSVAIHRLDTLPNELLHNVFLFLDAKSLSNNNAVKLVCKSFSQSLDNANNDFWKQVFIGSIATNRDQPCNGGELGDSTWYDLCPLNSREPIFNSYVSSFKCGNLATDPSKFIDKCDKSADQHDWKRIVRERTLVDQLFDIVQGLELPIAGACPSYFEPLYVFNNDPDLFEEEILGDFLKDPGNTNADSFLDDMLERLNDHDNPSEETREKLLRLKSVWNVKKQQGLFTSGVEVCSDDAMGLTILYLMSPEGSLMGLFVSSYY